MCTPHLRLDIAYSYLFQCVFQFLQQNIIYTYHNYITPFKMLSFNVHFRPLPSFLMSSVLLEFYRCHFSSILNLALS